MTGRRLGNVFRALADPRLEGARCAGHAPLFDVDGLQGEEPHETRYRIEAAARMCAGCPVLSACTVAVGELGTAAVGVWAGRAHGQAGRHGRPRKQAKAAR